MTREGDLTRRLDLDIQPPAEKSAFLLKSPDCPERPTGTTGTEGMWTRAPCTPPLLKGRGRGRPAPHRC